MRIGTPNSRRRTFVRLIAVAALLALTFLIAGSTPFSRVGSNRATDASAPGEIITPAATALVDFSEMARVQALSSAEAPPVRVLLWPETIEEPAEVPAPAGAASSLGAISSPVEPLSVQLASPPPTQNYMGLDDIPMADSSFIIIPPDVSGAVGPTKVMESFNNNYRIRDKATGVTISTVGTATFWAAVTLPSERLSLTDPRLTFDPYTCRWVAAMQTVGLGGAVLVAVSQTSDPSGAWFQYKFNGFPIPPAPATGYQLDFPMLGFNKNWVAVSINQYTQAGAFSRGILLALNYPLLQTGTGTGTLFVLSTGAASTHFCASPAVTYSPTEDSLFVVTHLSSAGATYAVDVISGTPGAPVYNLAGVAATRPGGGWTQPSGNQQPQNVPLAGASVCAPPCKIESSDAQVRADPIYRNGFLWYAQTIGLPAGVLTRTAAQWTRITPSTSPAFVDGGRIDDPTATATNGGKWYDHASLSVNANNDVMIGFTQFSSAQYPSAGYAMHLSVDPSGSTRDALIYKAGEDYYHKTFTTATGRNRWGDFTTVIVDPCDDQTLWCLQEYAKTRTGTNDGNTGSNSSKWSTWWAAVAGPLRLAGATCPPDTIGAAGSAVGRWFRIFNNGSAPDQFNYSITDASGWGGPVSGTTPVLAPSSFFDVFVNFTLPSACVPPSDLVTLSITPVGGCSTCFTPFVCTTTIYCDLATATLVGRFDALAKAGSVDLVWESDAVGQIRGWNLYRSSTADAGFARINADVIPMAAGGEFHFTDDTAVDGGAYYRLGAVMSDGAERVMQTLRYSASGTSRALEFRIAGNNPFRSSTMLHYSLPSRVPVRIDVYTITGQRAATLVNRTEDAGVHSVPFLLNDSGRKLGAGVYLVRLRAGNETRTLRAIALQ